MAASRVMLGAAVVAGATLLRWLVAGARVIGLVDRVTTAPQGPPTAPTEFTFDERDEARSEEPKLVFGDRQLTAPRSWRVVDRLGDHFATVTPQGATMDPVPLVFVGGVRPGVPSSELAGRP